MARRASLILLVPVLAVSAAIIALVIVGALRSSDGADWLRVETPSLALRGTALTVRVTLAKAQAGRYLSVDLHGMTGERKSRGYLTGSKPVLLASGQKSQDFSLPLGSLEQATSVFAVVYLSATGSWGTRVAVAITDPLPLLAAGERSAPGPLAEQRTHDLARDRTLPLDRRGERAGESTPLRFLVAAFWLGVLVLCRAGFKGQGWTGMAVAAAIAAIWEASDASRLAGESLRQFAQQAGVYSERRGSQEIVTIVAMVLFAIVALILSARRRKAGNASVWKAGAWILLASYWILTFLKVLSLHEVDSLLSQSLGGLNAGQLARLTVSAACLAVTGRFGIPRLGRRAVEGAPGH